MSSMNYSVKRSDKVMTAALVCSHIVVGASAVRLAGEDVVGASDNSSSKAARGQGMVAFGGEGEAAEGASEGGSVSVADVKVNLYNQFSKII